jgi:hypothetical protein
MQIDYDYLNEIFKVFLDSEAPTVDWESFEELRNNNGNNDNFIFHIRLLSDGGLIANTNGESSVESLGILPTAFDYVISITPWRLTLNGHDFANKLAKPEVLSVIKDKFKKDGLSTVMEVATEIVKQIANKKLEELFK